MPLHVAIDSDLDCCDVYHLLRGESALIRNGKEGISPSLVIHSVVPQLHTYAKLFGVLIAIGELI